MRGSPASTLFRLFILALALLSSGCGDDADSAPVRVDEPPLRIVSLAPALTQMVIDIGQAQRPPGLTG